MIAGEPQQHDKEARQAHQRIGEDDRRGDHRDPDQRDAGHGAEDAGARRDPRDDRSQKGAGQLEEAAHKCGRQPHPVGCDGVFCRGVDRAENGEEEHEHGRRGDPVGQRGLC